METPHTQLLERYFDGLLSPKEIEELNQLRQTDEAVQQEFELFEKAHQAVKLSTVIALKSEIKEIHQNMGTTKPSKVIPLIRLGIAASVLCILGIAFYAQRYSNQNLYEKAFSPVGDYVTNMDSDLSELEKAMSLFDQQQFDRASLAFENIYLETGDQVALFYAGHSHYQAGELHQAIESLEKISNSYRSEAQWYAALAYLKMDDTQNTLRMLEVILDQNEDEKFVLKATKLKNEMNSPLRNLVF